MPFAPDELVQVARIGVRIDGLSKEYEKCWISIDTDLNQVGIWLKPGRTPSLVVPLVDASIVWREDEEVDPPLPGNTV